MLYPAELRAQPIRRIQCGFFRSVSWIDDRKNADAEYLRRPVHLVEGAQLGGTYLLYALDWRYDHPPHNGYPNKQRTDLFVDNTYIVELTTCLNEKQLGSEHFIPVGSVHPYRSDALDALRDLSKWGVRFIKWLSPAQNIDPADRLVRPFFREMHHHGMVLLTHTGDEHTLHVEDKDQDLGNPERLSLALEEGVNVVMLHAGRDGKERIPGSDGARRLCRQRFLEMMKRYRENLFGEISVVPYLGTHGLLQALLSDDEICDRLINGSDYPAPAISLINPTARLLRDGYLTEKTDPDGQLAGERKRALDEIQKLNPLLFDFVMKRTIRVNGRKIPDSVFRSIDTKLALSSSISSTRPSTNSHEN